LARSTTPTWRAGRFKNLHLCGRQNLGELCFGFLFQLLDLLLLIVGEVEFLLGKPRNQMKAGRRRPAAGTTLSTWPALPLWAATLTAAVVLRGISPGILCQGTHGDRGT
jgi:hypothetical protein